MDSSRFAVVSTPGATISGVDLRSLPDGTRVVVETCNSRYRLVMREGDECNAVVQGGRYLREATEVQSRRLHDRWKSPQDRLDRRGPVSGAFGSRQTNADVTRSFDQYPDRPVWWLVRTRDGKSAVRSGILTDQERVRRSGCRDFRMTHATILIVDDEDLIRWSLRERLRAEGYEICEAGTGQAALEQFKEGVDLVLLDYRLPDTDGLSVLRELKKLDPDMLVILLTAFVSVETAVEAMKLGAFHFANKPFNLDDVAAHRRPGARDDAAAARSPAVARERGAPLQPARHRRRVRDDGIACGSWWRRWRPARRRRCC